MLLCKERFALIPERVQDLFKLRPEPSVSKQVSLKCSRALA